MASVRKSDVPEIAEFMTRFWEFIKKYWIPEDGDEYWKPLCDDARRIGNEYPHKFCKHMMASYVDYLEKTNKGKRGE